MTPFIKILSFVVSLILLGLLFAFPFMWAWNYAVVAAITIAKPIAYWQAYVLFLFFTFFLKPTSINE